MSKWVGYAVSVNCGEPLGCYQGTILEADGTTITLTKAFRNGFPYPKSQVTLNAADIKELKIIEARTEPSEQTHSTVAVTKNNKKCQRATVCENLQANPSSSGNQANVNPGSSSSKSSNTRTVGSGTGPARSKPIDIQASRPTNKNNTHTGSYGNSGSTPKGRGNNDKARRRNEACFGDLAEPAVDDDFDFEGNLALFDKRALWERMRHAHKPDLVRQADEAGAKLRHDENVLGGGGGGELRGIVLPEELRGPVDYVTDDGVIVPSAVPTLRRQIYDTLDRLGMAECTRTLLARAACDVALRLVGGTRRLEPRNAHQAPRAVALIGPHCGGAVGARCLRLLLAHGARGAIHVGGGGDGGSLPPALQRELAALAMDDVKPTPLERLPTPDIVLLALDDLRGDYHVQQDEILSWARGARAACVAIEPSAAGWAAWGVACRAAVVGGLPPAADDSLGRLYLAAVGPPARLLRDLRIQYRPPFGAASVLALHPSV